MLAIDASPGCYPGKESWGLSPPIDARPNKKPLLLGLGDAHTEYVCAFAVRTRSNPLGPTTTALTMRAGRGVATSRVQHPDLGVAPPIPLPLAMGEGFTLDGGF